MYTLFTSHTYISYEYVKYIHESTIIASLLHNVGLFMNVMVIDCN